MGFVICVSYHYADKTHDTIIRIRVHRTGMVNELYKAQAVATAAMHIYNICCTLIVSK